MTIFLITARLLLSVIRPAVPVVCFLQHTTTSSTTVTSDAISTTATHLPTAKEYREAINKNAFQFTAQWSKPLYQCRKCGGGMCKNLMVVLTTYPAQYEYQCDKCGYMEYQHG